MPRQARRCYGHTQKAPRGPGTGSLATRVKHGQTASNSIQHRVTGANTGNQPETTLNPHP